MPRVRTKEEVEEIKLRERIKLSLVRQQIDLNRLIGVGGCPTARGKVYITSIFQKNGHLSVARPHLALECQIRQHLNQKDVRMRRAAVFEPRLEEADIREYCARKTFKDLCPAYRRFIEETDSVIVKRILPPDEQAVTLRIDAAPRETLEPVKPVANTASIRDRIAQIEEKRINWESAIEKGLDIDAAVEKLKGLAEEKAALERELAGAAPPRPSAYSPGAPQAPGHEPHKSAGYSIYNRPGAKPDPHGVHGHKAPPPRSRPI